MINRAYIIDDDEISIFLTSMMLEADFFAHQIESYPCAEEALKNLQTMPEEQLPQVILLDLNMPVLSGWDFLDALSVEENRYLGKCNVFILTSSVDPLEKELANKYKLVKGFLHKPLSEDNLSYLKRLH